MFITLEGTEGSGKTTQMKLLADELERRGHRVTTTCEPGGDAIGESIRNILLHGQEMEPLAELMLFLADRAQHVSRVIRPALAAGDVVLCDRYIDSTICYQGHARGLDVEYLRSLNDFVTNGLKPDLTLLFDLTPVVGLERRRRERQDRLDAEDSAFHERVRAGFLAEAARDPMRIRVVNANRSIELVFDDALNALLENLSNKRAAR